MVSVASDRAPEILKAIREAGSTSEPSIAGDAIHNSFAESAVRTVKQGAATLLLQSGLPLHYWKWAQRCFAFSCNAIMEPSKEIQDAAKRAEKELANTRFAAHLGYGYEGYLILFGALVWFRDKSAATYEAKGSPAVYLGPEIIAGMKFKGAHVVVSLKALKNGEFNPVITRSLALPNGKWTFPMAKASLTDQDNPRHALPDAESFTPPEEDVPREPELLPLTPVPPTPGRAPNTPGRTAGDSDGSKSLRNQAITKLRIAIHGKTPKCPGCSYGSYNHNAACRNRFNELLDFHEPIPPAIQL